jgi:arsenate reductase-like glutaredoxin family protein
MTTPFISHELYLIYDPSSGKGKKVHALASTLSPVVHEIDIRTQSVSPLRWKELTEMLQLNPMDLFNRNHRKYQELIANSTYSEQDVLEILSKNPDILLGPVAVLGGRAVLCEDANDILKLSVHHETKV